MFVAELTDLRPDWIVLTNNRYGEPKSPHAWRFVPLRVYSGEDPPRHRWLTYAEELQQQLDYPLFLETRTHRVYRRPEGEP